MLLHHIIQADTMEKLQVTPSSRSGISNSVDISHTDAHRSQQTCRATIAISYMRVKSILTQIQMIQLI